MKEILSLNLDLSFNPTNYKQIGYNSMVFNGGEHNIKITTPIDSGKIDKVVITNRFTSASDIIRLLLAKDALKLKGISNVELIMPYLPYARQDRVCNDGESFSLKVFCDLINAMNFSKVTIIDCHSDVGPALLNNCVNISPSNFVKIVCFDIESYGVEKLLLISPDAGSNKKCNKIFSEVGLFSDIIKCDKKRNLETGELSGFEVFSNDLSGTDCLIVDDICDGGRTFIGVAEELKKKNAGNIYLYITHGIFSNGFDDLKKHFKYIYTTDSFKNISEESVKQIKIEF